jgi:NAD(P)H-quinone oxidoreductase subunit 5
MRPGRRPGTIAKIAEVAGLTAMAIALVTVGLLGMHGPSTATVLRGLSIRLDVISVVMLFLVSFVGWVVLRYVWSYVDGEARQGAFMG